MENYHAINGKTHYKWPFSIAMLNYQRVTQCLELRTVFFFLGFSGGATVQMHVFFRGVYPFSGHFKVNDVHSKI